MPVETPVVGSRWILDGLDTAPRTAVAVSVPNQSIIVVQEEQSLTEWVLHRSTRDNTQWIVASGSVSVATAYPYTSEAWLAALAQAAVAGDVKMLRGALSLVGVEAPMTLNGSQRNRLAALLDELVAVYQECGAFRTASLWLPYSATRTPADETP